MRRCLLLALAVGFPLAAATPLDDAFARLDKTAQQFKTVTADLNRDTHTVVINDDERDSGTMKFKRDKARDTRMLIEFTNANSVAFDGASLRVYYPKIKTVQEFDVGTKRSVVDQFLALGFGATSTELKDSYDVSFLDMEKIGSENAWHIQLIPKSKEVLQRLKKAELWISPSTGLPLQQKLVTSSTGDFMLVTYSNMKLTPSLSDGALKLSYPKGVKVEHPHL